MLVRRKEIAKRDITCYKFFIEKNNKICSPFRQYNTWEFGNTYIDKFPIIKNNKRAGSPVITQGCYHAYEYLPYVEHALERFLKNHRDIKAFIKEVVIPKGTTYYSDCCGQICSKTLCV